MNFRHVFAAVLALTLFMPACGAAPERDAAARDAAAKAAFVEANLLAVFYHELGHAVIDLLDVPIFGQEEDAADVMSVLLIDRFFDEEDAQEIIYDSAYGFLSDPDGFDEIAYWDVHGPDEQRYYNHICLFFGAATDVRGSLAEELGLPPDRAETCPEEHERAARSWDMIFDEMSGLTFDQTVVFAGTDTPQDGAANRILARAARTLNSDLMLPKEVTLVVTDCGEPNAFYDPETVSITICREFVPHLENLYDALSR
ncbi:MAG: DUF4344 domain-containing metallopeptidase [Pseudomonadota bacterium]